MGEYDVILSHKAFFLSHRVSMVSHNVVLSRKVVQALFTHLAGISHRSGDQEEGLFSVHFLWL